LNRRARCEHGAQYLYSGDGNLTSKGAATGSTGNIGALTYGNTSRPNNAGPHAVASANGKTYIYDANGNFTNYSDNTRSIGYTPFNLPLRISGTNPNIAGLASLNVLNYQYDADHQRVSEQTDSGATTLYVGPGFFEAAYNPDGTREYRHYLAGPEGTIGIRTVRADDTNTATNNGNNSTTRYWYKDHLGSPASEYDAGGYNLTALGFDTWGLRRKSTAANSFTQSLSTADLSSYQSPRGYTGHEHLDEVGLIHMNGRIYDPMIGRFLQPDPIISEPYNSQNFNRYAYVLNNPLMYTDPSGYSTWTEIRRPVAAIVVAVVTYNVALAYQTAGLYEVYTAADIAAIKATSAVASGFASGGVSGGNIESAIAGAFSAGLFFGVGDLGFASGSWQNVAAHAAAGCVSAGVQGGNCGQGALSAGFAELAGPRLITGNVIADTAVHATLGGAGSVIGGGKFGNGAITGAFGYLFNCGVHDCYNRRIFDNLPQELALNVSAVEAMIRATGDKDLISKLDSISYSYVDSAPVGRDGAPFAAEVKGSRVFLYNPLLKMSDYSQRFVAAHELAHGLLPSAMPSLSQLLGATTPNYEAAADSFAIKLLKIPTSQRLPRNLDQYYQGATDDQRRRYYPGRSN
jgi:RHS repeat-associated protein